MNVDPRWYETFFERDWLELIALRRAPERTQQEVEFIVGALALEPGARVLDLACGHGRIALELARRGCRVTSLDLSEPSLALAREAAERDGLDVDFVHGDMRELPFADEFDAVVNVYSSWGYFESEDDDQRVFDEVAKALRAGGAFLIDTVHAAALFRRYRERSWEELEDGVVFLQEGAYDHLRGRNQATWTFIRPDGERSELRHSLRIYTPPEIAKMLARAALEVEEAWGDFEGGELTFDAWRLILRARKPRR